MKWNCSCFHFCLSWNARMHYVFMAGGSVWSLLNNTCGKREVPKLGVGWERRNIWLERRSKVRDVFLPMKKAQLTNSKANSKVVQNISMGMFFRTSSWLNLTTLKLQTDFGAESVTTALQFYPTNKHDGKCRQQVYKAFLKACNHPGLSDPSWILGVI